MTVAPLMYWGISLIAEESFNSQGSPARRNKPEAHDSRLFRRRSFAQVVPNPLPINQKLHNSLSIPNLSISYQYRSLGVIALFITLSLIYLTWQEFGAFWLYLFLLAAFFSYVQFGKSKRKREEWKRKLDLEIPGLTQALTLMISAGVSPITALQIISKRSDSLVAREMEQVVYEVMSGKSTVAAMDAFAKRVESSGSRRFSNAVSIAIERGTPLVPVLVALLKDAQVDSKNELLRRAGKAEIALMLPVVFLLLPISVLFALFPSILQLQAF